jgi:enoyl-CoA hydratase/carnithine racemase
VAVRKDHGVSRFQADRAAWLSLHWAAQGASISTRRWATRSPRRWTESRGDANVRVVVVTGGAPGYFIRHFSVAALIRLAESLRASGREWPENATYNGGFFDKAMALCESMSKPVIAAISGTCLAGGFEFALSCDLRIAEDGDYLIGLPEAHLGLLPGAGGTQRLPRTIGTPAALMHILMGQPLISPRRRAL